MSMAECLKKAAQKESKFFLWFHVHTLNRQALRGGKNGTTEYIQFIYSPVNAF